MAVAGEVGMRTRARLASLALLLASTTLWVTRTVDARQDPFLGRWRLTSTATRRPTWAGSRSRGRRAADGAVFERGGSPTPVASVQIRTVSSCSSQPLDDVGRRPNIARAFRAKSLIGSTTSGDRTIAFVGVRPPKWPAADASATHQFGPPVELFDGKSMDAWDLVRPDQPWFVINGEMTNSPAV